MNLEDDSDLDKQDIEHKAIDGKANTTALPTSTACKSVKADNITHSKVDTPRQKDDSTPKDGTTSLIDKVLQGKSIDELDQLLHYAAMYPIGRVCNPYH